VFPVRYELSSYIPEDDILHSLKSCTIGSPASRNYEDDRGDRKEETAAKDSESCWTVL
jgi:hypothetical protein